MAAPISLRLEKMLEVFDRRGLLVEAVTVKGEEIHLTIAQPKGGAKTASADLVNWKRT